MRSIALLSFVLVAFQIGDAQQNSAPSSPALFSVHAQQAGEAVNIEGLIRLDIQVSDESGHAKSGLQRDDFTLLDNGKPQQIVAFHETSGDNHAISSPLSVDLLIDTLDLPVGADVVSFERSQVLAFLRQNNGRLPYPVTIYSLDNTGLFLTSKSSIDGNVLAKDVVANAKLQPLFTSRSFVAGAPQSSYAIRPAPVPIADSLTTSPLLAGLQALSAISTEEDPKPGRKVLLWVGPGYRDKGTGSYSGVVASRNKKEQRDVFDNIIWISALLRQARVTVEVFSAGESEASATFGPNATGFAMDEWKDHLSGVSSADEGSMMDLYKKVLAVESGGRTFPASDDLVQQMNDSLLGQSSYYTLTFDPPPAAHGDEYHGIEVKLGAPGLTAHTSTGYYDEPYYTDAPRSGTQLLTVEQLDQQLKQNGGTLKSAQTELSERLPEAQLDALLGKAHDTKTRDTLELAAAKAALRMPPAANIIADPPPPAKIQQKILLAASQYLDQIIPRLPNFTAVRQSKGFGETAAFDELGTYDEAIPFHVTERSTASVLYRQGDEIVQVKGKDVGKEKGQVSTHGTFGPVLQNIQLVLSDPKNLSWSRWEQVGGKRLAVFRDTVTAELANYRLNVLCCLIDADAGANYDLYPSYKGELAIDPDSGAIFRVVIETELGSFVPIHHNDLVIDYGSVEISGHSFILPLRSVNILRKRSLKKLQLWDQSLTVWGPYETRIETFSFESYHVFHVSSQIRPSLNVIPDPEHK